MHPPGRERLHLLGSVSRAVTEVMAPGVQPWTTEPRKVWGLRRMGGWKGLHASTRRIMARMRKRMWRELILEMLREGRGSLGDLLVRYLYELAYSRFIAVFGEVLIHSNGKVSTYVYTTCDRRYCEFGREF